MGLIKKNIFVRDNFKKELQSAGVDDYFISPLKKSDAGDYQWRHKLNANIKEYITASLVGETVTIDKLVDAIELLKERLYLDGVTFDEVLAEVDKRKDEHGGYSKRLITTGNLDVPNEVYFRPQKPHYINHRRYQD